ncbi:MAG: hypothetical protein HY332_24565 [Chloroflexi bacterium]|nr:hypothetical protein [Chloroflexota bacterium]
MASSRASGRQHSNPEELALYPFTRRAGFRTTAAALAAAGGAHLLPRLAGAQATPASPTQIIGDVLDFALSSDRWRGRFGFVTFRLHAGLFNGDRAFFIRTDASDPDFAREIGAVFVPKLANAVKVSGSTSDIFLFDNTAATGQLPVLSSVPNREDFSPAFRANRVTWSSQPQTLTSADAVRRAAQNGQLRIDSTTIVVNYPVVKWPGGELPADTTKAEYLGGGQLLDPVDTAGMRVTFKLHECFPSSRYIVTDTSAAPMAPMMQVGAAAAAQKLAQAEATAKIYVFGNGVKGSGPMGGQPSVFDSVATQPAWSPFWDHLTVVWRTTGEVPVLKTEAEITPRIDGGQLQLFNGVPDSHPNGFVVNCPVPVLAPNTYTPGSVAGVPLANDGRALPDEGPHVYAMFKAVWGDRAAEQWVKEHNESLTRR